MESLHTAAIPIAGSNVQYSRFQHRDAQTKPGLPPAAKGARDPFFQPGQSIIAGPGTNFLSGAADRERSYRLPFPERTMTFQLKQGKHFHPVGWDLVRNEAILKQEKLQVGSVAMVGDWRKEGKLRDKAWRWWGTGARKVGWLRGERSTRGQFSWGAGVGGSLCWGVGGLGGSSHGMSRKALWGEVCLGKCIDVVDG